MAKKTATIWVATLESRSFSFEAFGATEADAREAMEKTLRAHARSYQVSFTSMMEEYRESIECHERQIGAGYRDGEQICPKS